MTSIIIGKIGKILSGDEQGKFIKIIDDRDTGGFIILTGEDREFHHSYDNWVEDETALLYYFRESHWLIEWSK